MRSFLALLFFSSGLAMAAGDCSKSDPAAFAREFFQQHRDFYFQQTRGLAGQVTPALMQALKRHYRCAEREGLCHLDYDPWLGAQDGEMRGAASFAATPDSQGGSRVSMAFDFELDPGQPAEKRLVILELEAGAAPRCWRVRDLITPLVDSLASRYRGRP